MLFAPSQCAGVLGSWYNRIDYDHMPKPRLTLRRQHNTLGSPVGQIRITFDPSSLADRCMMTGRVLQAQRLVRAVTTANKVIDLARAATTRGEAEEDKDWRGVSAPPQKIRAPCRVCGENMKIRDRLAFSGWAVLLRSALNTAEGAVDEGEDWFRIALTGETELLRWGAVHLVDFLPRLHMRIYGAANGGGGQQLRIARLWMDVTPGAGDEGNERDGGWRLRGRPVMVAGNEPCSYCGRALDDLYGG